MNTGLQSFSNPAEIGILYPFADSPFAGGEVILVVVGVALWIAWHIWEIRFESRNQADGIRKAHEAGIK